jgi:hypothetical protein
MTYGIKAKDAGGVTTFDTDGLLKVMTLVGVSSWSGTPTSYATTAAQQFIPIPGTPLTFTVARTLSFLVLLEFVGYTQLGSGSTVNTSWIWPRAQSEGNTLAPFPATLHSTVGVFTKVHPITTFRWVSLAAGSWTWDAMLDIPAETAVGQAGQYILNLLKVWLSVYKFGGP